MSVGRSLVCQVSVSRVWCVRDCLKYSTHSLCFQTSSNAEQMEECKRVVGVITCSIPLRHNQVVSWLLNVAPCKVYLKEMSGWTLWRTATLKRCKSNLLPQSVTAHRQRANLCYRRQNDAWCLVKQSPENQFWVICMTHSGIAAPTSPALEADAFLQGHRGCALVK